YPVLIVAMTHHGVIEWLAGRLRSGSVKLHNQTSLRRYPYLKPQYKFQLFGKPAQLLCSAILPYLKVKAEPARLVGLFRCDARIAPGVKIDRTQVNDIRFRLRE